MINSLINCILRLWARFVKNIYKDESYLTHTLPIEKKTIYASKLISTLITIFTTTLVIIACLFICYYSEANLELLKTLLELAATTYNTTVINLLLLISFVIFLEILFIVLIGYVGIILGHKANQNKMLKSIIKGIVIYFALQAVTLVIIAIFGFFNSDIMNLINTTDIIDINAIKTVMYLGIAIYIGYIIFLYFLGKKQIERGVNIE